MNTQPKPTQEITLVEVAKTAAQVAEESTPAGQTRAMLQMIREIAASPNFNAEALKTMMELQRQFTKDQAEMTFNRCLAEMSAEMPRVKKSGVVEYAEDKNKKDGPKKEAFKFAKFEDIDTAIRPLLVKYGFSLSFSTEPRAGEGGGLTMVGRLSHIQGHSREARIAVALDSSGGKNNIQAMGSSSSYGKRYVTCMLLNIITEGEDDDGNKAEVITEDQAAKLKDKIKVTGTDVARFLKLFGVPSVDEIQTRDFDKAAAFLALKDKTKGAA